MWLRPEWAAFGREFLLELFRAIAAAAGPRFGAIDVATPAAGMGILDFEEVKVLFPIRPLLSEWFVAIADLDPLHSAVFELACFRHVSEVFTTRNGSAAKRSIKNGARQCFCSSRLYFCSHQVTHLKSLAEPQIARITQI